MLAFIRFTKEAKEKRQKEYTLAVEEGFAIEDEEELHRDDYPVEFFYLWPEHEEVFSVFRTIRPFMAQDGSPDTSLILALCKEKCLNIEQTLQQLSFILHGYLKEAAPAPETKEN